MTLARSTALIGAALLAGAPPARAWDGSKAFQACIAATGGSDPGMAECARAELVRQDRRLNAAYAARLAAADGTLKEAVRTSQRAWLGYRDATCKAEGAVHDGGTMQPLAQAGCEVRLTIDRTAWLKGLEP